MHKKIISALKIVFSVLALLLLASGQAFAIAPPLNDRNVPPIILNQPGGAENLGRMVQKRASVRSGYVNYSIGDGISVLLQNYIKQTGEVKLIAILVEFSDVKMSAGGRERIAGIFDGFTSYFKEQSCGKMNVTCDISSKIYGLSNGLAYYGLDERSGSLVSDAVLASDADIDFSKYQCVMIVHAGYGDETNPGADDTNDIWSRYWYQDSIATGDSVTVNGATIVPELEYEDVSPLGIMCHEFGHQLGLPDLYDTSYGTEGGIGFWGLMATGAYNGTPKGTKPAMIDPWCRQKLNWIEYTVITTAASNFEFESGKLYRISGNQNQPQYDYFLVEKRARIPGTYDEGLPGEGLLIYHVNAAAALETSLRPNDSLPGLIQLLPANGGNHLSSGPPRSKIRGLSTDPFPIAANRDFYYYSAPSSRTWGQLDSGVEIRNIQRISSGASLRLTADINIGGVKMEYFNSASFLIPGASLYAIVTAKPRFLVSGVPELELSAPPQAAKTYKMTLSGRNGVYYAIVKFDTPVSRANVKLTCARSDGGNASSESFVFYY